MTNTSTPAFSVSEVMNASWEITKKQWLQYLILFGAIFLIYGAFFVVFRLLLNDFIEVPEFVINLLSILVGTYVAIITARAALALAKNHKLDLPVLLKVDSKTYLQALIGMILYSIIIMVGLVLFIIPGIIASIMFGFYMYSIVDAKTDGIQSLEDSMNMTRGHKLTIFLYQFIVLILGFAAVGIPAILGVGLFAAAGGFDGGTVGAGIVLAIVALVAMVVLGLGLSMYTMSGMAFMYTKLRTKTPLKVK